MTTTLQVTGPILEQAGRSMSHGTVEQQQRAADFLAAWKSSGDALSSACRFLSCEFSNIVQFLSSAVVLSAVTDTWFKYDRDSLNQMRQSICGFTFSQVCYDNAMLSDQMTSTVAVVAFNDWPDHWPEFLPLLCQTMQLGPTEKRQTIVILRKFLDQVYTSYKITLRRRASVVAQFLENVGTILDCIDIVHCMEHVHVVSAYLEFACSLTKLSGLSDAFVCEYSAFLFERGFFGQQFGSQQRTLMYIYNENTDSYTVNGVMEGKGDTVVILDAMKMENNITSDRAGKISEICVQPGMSVMEGTDLVIFE